MFRPAIRILGQNGLCVKAIGWIMYSLTNVDAAETCVTSILAAMIGCNPRHPAFFVWRCQNLVALVALWRESQTCTHREMNGLGYRARGAYSHIRANSCNAHNRRDARNGLNSQNIEDIE